MPFTSNTKDFQVLQWHLYQSRKTRRLARKTLLPFQHFAFFRIPQADPCAHTDVTATVSADHVRACRYIDASDKTCEWDHSLRLKLPSLSPLSFLRLGRVILLALYFGGPSSSTLSHRDPAWLSIASSSSLSSCFLARPPLLERAILSVVCIHPRTTYTYGYPRDRIKRIRVWWIEFNMVITSDENASRLCSKELGGKALESAEFNSR